MPKLLRFIIKHTLRFIIIYVIFVSLLISIPFGFLNIHFGITFAVYYLLSLGGLVWFGNLVEKYYKTIYQILDDDCDPEKYIEKIDELPDNNRNKATIRILQMNKALGLMECGHY